MLAGIGVVACGGACGAVLRFLSVVLIQTLSGGRYPFGTWFVNSSGSFLVGFIMVLLMERFVGGENWRLFLVVGFLGGYTTFSSYSWETWMLYQDGDIMAAALNIVLNNLTALGLVLLGMICGRWIGGII